ncbi:MAG: hypothetical protein ABIQ47_10410 [Tepidiformaceae bacterium]
MLGTRIAAGLCALAVALASLLSAAPAVQANGVPQLVKLTYLEGLSNWGPKDGEGVLEFSFAEAYARVDVKNLKLTDGFSYEGWLTGGQGEPLLVGKISVQPSGLGTLETKLQSLKRFDYDTFVVAGRGPAEPEAAYPARRSIAGRFTVLKDGSTSTAADTRPAVLPNTGETAALSTSTRLLRVGLAVLAAGGLAAVVLRTRKRRDSRD